MSLIFFVQISPPTIIYIYDLIIYIVLLSNYYQSCDTLRKNQDNTQDSHFINILWLFFTFTSCTSTLFFFFLSNTILLTKWNTNLVEFLTHFKVQSQIKLNLVIFCFEQRFGIWMGIKNLSPKNISNERFVTKCG